jgi:hypothetical protein
MSPGDYILRERKGFERGGGRGTCWFPVEEVRETVGFASAVHPYFHREIYSANTLKPDIKILVIE